MLEKEEGWAPHQTYHNFDDLRVIIFLSFDLMPCIGFSIRSLNPQV